jgi:hypothetical protein
MFAPPVKPLRRSVIAVLGSAVVHGLPLVTFATCSFGVDIELPEFEFELTEVEFIDPDQQLGEGAPEPEPEPEPPPPEIPPEVPPELPPEADSDGAAEPEPEPEKPKPKFGDKKSRVDSLGPANSNFFMLLAAKKVAGLSYADSVVEIMAALPDFIFIIEGGGFHALRDFEYLVIASPDIRDLTQTFLAVEYKLPRAEMQAGLDRAAAERGQKIPWEERDGHLMGNPIPLDPGKRDWDPRWFVFLDDKVAVYVREEFLPQVLTGPDQKKGKTAGNFVANLTKIRTFAAREPKAGLQMQLKDIHASVKMVKTPFTIPDAIEVMAEAAAEPELVVKMEFLDAPAALTFEGEWRDLLPKFIDDRVPILFRGLARGLYDQIELTRDDGGVLLRSKFSKTQATLILDQVAAMSGKMLRRTPEELEESRRRRDELWKARQGGKVPPSVALEQLGQAKLPGEATPPAGEASPPAAGDPPPASPPVEPPASPPVEPPASPPAEPPSTPP